MENGDSVKELISVVIPIYNVEHYLDRCLNSVVNQTYGNLEIILVDDGATDSSPEICEKWALKDKRIKVIHKKNAGLGMARNTGIENATGSYLCFFDSDDYVDSKTIELSHSLMKKEAPDIVIFGLRQIDQSGKTIVSTVPNMEKSVYSGSEVLECILPEIMGRNPKTGKPLGLPNSACTCMFSMDLIRRAHWRFVSEREIISEDTYSLLMLYAHVDKVAILPEELYFYCVNTTSLTHSYQEGRFEKIKHFYHECVDLCREYSYPVEVERRCMSSFLGNTIPAMKQEVLVSSNRSEGIGRIRKIIDDELLQWVLKEKAKDKVRMKIALLFWAMRHKYYRLCYMLLFAQNAKLAK